MPVPIVDYLVLDEGAPRLRAHACDRCGALFVSRRNACGSCGGTTFEPRDLATTGTLRTFTVVHRAYPGIPTPFVAAVVALDGGGVIRTNLTGIDPDPEAITVGMPLELVTLPAGSDRSGNEAISFAFAPRSN